MTKNHEKSRTARIFQNFGYLTIGKLIGDAFTFALFVILSRTYGQEGIGQYSFAMALTGFFAVVSDFGLFHLSIKEISRMGKDINSYVGKLLCVRILLTLIIFSALLIVAFALKFSPDLLSIILLIGAYQIIYTLVDGQVAIFIAKENMLTPAILESSLKILIAVIGISIALLGGTLATVVGVFPLVTFIYIFLTFYVVTKFYRIPKMHFSFNAAYLYLKEAVPYAFMLFLNQLSTRIDVVFLGFILGVAAAGIYNTAYRLIFMLLIISNFASMALFPVMSKLYVSSKNKLQELYEHALNTIIIIGIPATVGLWMIAPELILLIYGDQFTDSIFILQLLAWLLLIVCIHQLIGTVLTASDRQHKRTKCQWIAAICNIVGNAILIPTIGIKGAAIATLLSESILVLLLAYEVKQYLTWPHIGSRLIISSIGATAFCLPYFYFKPIPIIVAIPSAAIIYFVTLYSFKEIRTNELNTIINIIKN